MLMFGQNVSTVFHATQTPKDFIILCSLMAIDIVTGILKGTKYHTLKSAVMAVGIRKKAGILLSIALGVCLDYAFAGGHLMFTSLMLGLSLCNEALSIIENLGQLGVPIPKVVSKRIETLKDALESEAENIPEMEIKKEK